MPRKPPRAAAPRTSPARPAAPVRRRSGGVDPRRVAGATGGSDLSTLLSEFEFTLIIVMFGFTRWVETCMGAANVRGLSALDTLVLHAVNHRARGRRLSEICTVLNIDESHLVAYALKKLAAAGLVEFDTRGREHHYATTPAGDHACLAYRRVREEFLVRSLALLGDGGADLERIGTFLRAMSGLYDQAGRFATASSIRQPRVPALHTKR